MILAAHNQLLGLFATVGRSDPDLPFAHVGDNALRGNFRGIAGVDLSWLAAAPGDSPRRLLRYGSIAGGIWELTPGILPFPAKVNDSVATSTQIRVGERLPIVFGLKRYPHR